MPPEAAAVAEQPNLQVPVADQPPEHKPAAPFDARYAAMQAKLGISDDDEPEEAPEAAGAPAEPEKPKRNGDPTAGDKAMFEALAKKLGFAIEGSSVSVEERAEWRRAKAREKEAIARERAEWEKTKQTTPEQVEKVGKSDALIAALDAGDPDGFAAAVHAIRPEFGKTYNEIQANFIKRLADPNYMELRKLQQWKEQQEQERQKQEQEGRTRAQQEQHAQAYRAYMSDLTEKCKASSNPLVAAMHDDPLFLQAVYNVQKDHWDPDKQQTVPVEEAIRIAARGGQSLESELKGLLERLKKGFPEMAAAVDAATAGKPVKKAPRTGVVPVNGTSVASIPKKPSEMSPLEWREYTKRKLAESDD